MADFVLETETVVVTEFVPVLETVCDPVFEVLQVGETVFDAEIV